MKNNTPEKEGFDCGVRKPPAGNATPAELTATENAVAEENWDSGTLNGYRQRLNHDVVRQLPQDGLSKTKWDAVLSHGISVDNVQKPGTTVSFNLKDS